MRTLLAVAVVLCIGEFAHAAEPAWTKECAAVEEDDARLACYDARNPPNKRSAIQASSPAATATVRAPATAQATVPATAMPATPATSAATPSKDFGLPPQPQPAANTPDPDLVARVDTVSQRLTGELLLKLDNGQSWVQAQRKSNVIIKAGERVSIARGSFGGYLLSSDSGATMRVRRLQ